MVAVAQFISRTEHRPWPLENLRWVMHMRWHDLMFAHWPVDAAELRPHVPRELEVDTHHGKAWIGVVPFWMDGIRLRGLPPVPTVRKFAEINVRTYVTDGQRPGVWFLSLDAHSRLASAIARRWYNLAYSYARISRVHEDESVVYTSCRGDGRAVFTGRYRPTESPFFARPGTLEHWLCERYRMYMGGGDRPVYYGDIHHAPWPLQKCEARIDVNTMGNPLGITLGESAPHVMFAKKMEVAVWAPRRLRTADIPQTQCCLK